MFTKAECSKFPVSHLVSSHIATEQQHAISVMYIHFFSSAEPEPEAEAEAEALAGAEEGPAPLPPPPDFGRITTGWQQNSSNKTMSASRWETDKYAQFDDGSDYSNAPRSQSCPGCIAYRETDQTAA